MMTLSLFWRHYLSWGSRKSAGLFRENLPLQVQLWTCCSSVHTFLVPLLARSISPVDHVLRSFVLVFPSVGLTILRPLRPPSSSTPASCIQQADTHTGHWDDTDTNESSLYPWIRPLTVVNYSRVGRTHDTGHVSGRCRTVSKCRGIVSKPVDLHKT